MKSGNRTDVIVAGTAVIVDIPSVRMDDKGAVIRFFNGGCP